MLAPADDATDADGAIVLDYRQAIEAAREWWQGEQRKALGLGAASRGPYTVRQACENYLKHYAARGGKAEYSTRRTVETHIMPALGDIEVSKLTTRRIREWHHDLAAAPKFVRTRRAAVARATQAVDHRDTDALRSRRASANRVLTVLKAALNHAWRERLVGTDEAWRPVKPFAAVDAPVIRYLSADECRRLVNTCPPALRNLVRGALLTGARYGELTRLKVRDVNLDVGTLTIREAKGGRARHVVLTDEGRSLFAALTAGQPRDRLVFLRDDGEPWKPAQQTRPIVEASLRVKITPPIGFHVLRHTHATALAMRGVPMGVIAAQLGHADTRITERHYAHLAPSYIADTIRAHFPVLSIVGPEHPLTLEGR